MKQSEKDLPPIHIDLSGKCVPAQAASSSIKGDLRLAELDAFLHCLEESLAQSEPDKCESKFGKFLARTINRIKQEFDINVLELEVRSTLDPKSNKLTYTFKFNTKTQK